LAENRSGAPASAHFIDPDIPMPPCPLPRTAALLLLSGAFLACSRDRPAEEAAPPPAAPATAGEVPSTGGSVYEVRITRGPDGAAGFDPAVVTARRGDVVRFVLADSSGGVSFPRRGNPPDAPLPSPSPVMRQPGQVYEIPVDLPAGTYTFTSLPPGPGASTGRLTVSP
jgi:plastocyanin